MPFLNHRYLVPVLPALMVLGAVAIAELPLRVGHAALAVSVATLGAVALSAQSDTVLLRRQITLWLPLAVAFALWVLTVGSSALRRQASRAAASRAAAVLAAIAVGLGGAITLGVDRVAVTRSATFRTAGRPSSPGARPRGSSSSAAGRWTSRSRSSTRRRSASSTPPWGRATESNAQRLIREAVSATDPAFVIDDDAKNDRWDLGWPGWRFESVPGCPRLRRVVPP
jgi:hypothetical protein